MDGALRDRILDLNPWQLDPPAFATEVARRLPTHFVPRRVGSKSFGDPRRARLIVGPRQAGKSTLAWSVLRDREPRSVLYLNAEEGQVRSWGQSAAGLLADLAREFPSVRTVFIEEAQHLPEAGLLVKGLVDAGRGLEVIVTGSSSFHLLARTRESLAGRAEYLRLLPFSLAELSDEDREASPAARRIVRQRISDRMIVQGGYPGAWFAESARRELANLIEAFVLRDASDRFRIRHPEVFRRLLVLAAGQVGQMVNLAEWGANLGVSASTIRDYLGLLEETWILRLVPVFSGGRRRELTSARRVHFLDPGLRNALLGAFEPDWRRRPDSGALAEGFAFSEIVKSLPAPWEVHYWRAKGGAEVDFVLAGEGRLVGIEVKAGRPGGLSRSARSFIEAYEPGTFLVAFGAAGEAGTEETIGRTRACRVGLPQLDGAVRKAVAGVDSPL
jgi:predicted AAA+ superfamily ATPase